MQKARRSSIQSTRHSSRKTFHRHSSSSRTFQSFMTFQDIPVIPDILTLLALLHVPAPSSTNQYLPVLSSVSSISRDSTRSSISLIRMQILHTDWFPPETPLSANQRTIQDFLQTLHSSKKGRCCDIGHTFDIFYRIELRVRSS